MTRDLPVILNELLRFGQVAGEATQVFKSMKHNNDLCPQVTLQLNRLLESYVKYDAVAYDVQGIHDRGTDVVLRYWPEGGDEHDRWLAIAFQIKSFDDLNRQDYLKALRSQRLQAADDYGDRLTQYVVMLCTSSVEHRGKVREVSGALAKTEKTLVLAPQFCLRFIRLRLAQVRAAVDSFEKGDDVVISKARDELGAHSPLWIAVALWVVNCGLHGSEALDLGAPTGDPFLTRIAVATAHLDEVYDSRLGGFVHDGRSPEERIRGELDSLIGYLIELGDDDQTPRIDPSAARPLQALMLDLEVRYGVTGADLLEHAFDLLGVTQTWNLDLDEAGWGG